MSLSAIQEYDLGTAIKRGLLSLTAAATVALPFLAMPAEVTYIAKDARAALHPPLTLP